MVQSETQIGFTPRKRRTPALLKAVFQSDIVRRSACWLAATYIRLVYRTSRWEIVGQSVPQSYWAQGKPFILAFWHNRLLMMPYCWQTPLPMNMLISNHRDGEFIARTIAHFDLGTVRGSAGNTQKGGDKLRQKGGAQALRGMARAAAAGEALGITPDGPRGPRMRASDGVAAVAKLTGLPVIACAYSTSNARILNSWDKFVLALPFSRGAFVWGEPIIVDRALAAADLPLARAQIEAEITRVSIAADRLVGRVPIEPEEPPRDPVARETAPQ